MADDYESRILREKLGPERLAELAKQMTSGVGAATNTTTFILKVDEAFDLNRYHRGPGVPPVNTTASDGPWSQPNGPSQWALTFGCSWATLKRRFEEGKIRHKKLSTKSYCIHVDDLPKQKRQ